LKRVALISNGDFRDAVGVSCWPKQEETLRKVEQAFHVLGVNAYRAHPYGEEEKHGFITTQAECCRVFSQLIPIEPVVLVLKLHRGPILLLGNFDGTWPGLVSLLNHSASFDRMNIEHSKVWTDSFDSDERFMQELQTWVKTGTIKRSNDHVTSIDTLDIPRKVESSSTRLTSQEKLSLSENRSPMTFLRTNVF
jgi:hypothetical protein